MEHSLEEIDKHQVQLHWALFKLSSTETTHILKEQAKIEGRTVLLFCIN